MTTEQEAQILFLKYAFPCAGVTLARGHISQKEYTGLEKAVSMNVPLPWKTLEKNFVAAWRRIKEVAQELNTNPYDLTTIRRYYLEFHNKYIEKNDGSYAYAPPVLKKICRIERGTIIKKDADYYIVQFVTSPHETRPVSNLLCPNAQVRDTVSTHYGFAVEKLEP